MEVKTLEAKTTIADEADEKGTKEKMIDDNFGKEVEGRRQNRLKSLRLDSDHETGDFIGKPEDDRRYELLRSWRTLESKMEGFRRRRSYEKPGKDISENRKSEMAMMKMEDIGKNRSMERLRENGPNNDKARSLVWDCGSTLYDSFELNSFKRQLDSAISASARSLSMPHLPDRRLPRPHPADAPPPPSSSGKKSSNKISRSLQKLVKSLFKLPMIKHSSAPTSPINFKACRTLDVDQYYVVYDTSPGSLTTIPEAAEMDVGPEISSLVRRTASERFAVAGGVGISCA